jgi:MYXO-CTERM domain-containing protein
MKFAKLVFLAAALASCSSNESASSTSQSIIGGTPDGGDPSVVLLGGGGVWCTGTLVAPNVVLTAAHCISANNNFVYLGPQYLGDAGGSVLSVAKSYQHPDYATNKSVDIGIVVLSSSSAVTPSAFSTTAPTVNESVHVVGFGNTANPTEPSFTKMQVDVPISAVASDSFSTGPAICAGDSGGPAFASGVIAGVVSGHSIQACGGTAGYVRVDLYAQWIQQQVDLAKTTDAGPPPSDSGTSDAVAPSEAGSDGATNGSEPNDTSSSSGCSMSPSKSSSGAGFLALLAVARLVRRRRITSRG